jgi:hypothetical protein
MYARRLATLVTVLLVTACAALARKHLRLFIIVATLAGFGTAGSGLAVLAAQAVPGTYELNFFTQGPNGLVSVTTLPVCSQSVCEELILNAHITDTSTGLPAQGGLVTFQYCSYKGLPPNDISRPDEAPLEACANGTATWKNLAGSLKVDQSGDAFLDFGVVLIPRTVGFRFLYKGQGTIANGMSDPENFTWTAQ